MYEPRDPLDVDASRSSRDEKPFSGVAGTEAAAHEMRKMSRASRFFGDEPETEREAKKPHLAEEEEGTALHSTSPRSPDELAGLISRPGMIFAAFEQDKAQSQVKPGDFAPRFQPLFLLIKTDHLFVLFCRSSVQCDRVRDGGILRSTQPSTLRTLHTRRAS